MTEMVEAALWAAPEPDPARGRLRVVFMLRVPAAAQQRFLDEYERIRYQVANVGGYVGDQLCQSQEDGCEWMIVSEWQTPEHFYAWERTPEHRERARGLVECATERRSLRYVVRYQTLPGAAPAAPAAPAAATAPADPGGAR